MNIEQDKIQQCMNELHFEQALALLHSIPADQRTMTDFYRQGLCLCALYDWKQARQAFEQALKRCTDPQDRSEILLRLAYFYVQTNQLPQAANAMDQALPDLPEKKQPEAYFYQALLAYENGHVDQALKYALQVLQYKSDEFIKIRCEAATLAGDQWSVLGNLSKAAEAYHQALRLADGYPPNWKDLRKALIYNNLADIYEQFEAYEQARKAYQNAWKAMDQVSDTKISDLDGYRLELYCSMANFFALNDQFEDCDRVLEQARPLAKSMKMPLKLYWESRVDYIGGLSELYRENPLVQPFEKLFEAWKLQTRFLQFSPASSTEYLGKIAYYAAYCYDPKLAEGVSQEELYRQALDLFRACAFKDPSFYRFSIASIENELGTLERNQDPHKALEDYRQALHDFQTIVNAHPDDSEALLSICAVILNLLSVLPEELIKSEGVSLLDQLDQTLTRLGRDPEHQEAFEDALDRLMELDRLHEQLPAVIETLYSRHTAMPIS